MAERTPEDVLRMAQDYHKQGRLGEAENLYRAILSKVPNHPHAMHLLGLIYYQSGDLQRGLQLMERSVQLCADVPYFYLNIGDANRTAGNIDASVAAFKKAIELTNFPGAWYGLGQAYEKGGDFPNALAAYRKTVELNPNEAAAYLNIGVLIEQEGRLEEAMELFRTALQLKPDYPHAHVALGISLLRRGELELGWPHYEWRLRHPKFNSVRLDREYPLWDGSDLSGRTILIRAEQGLGDSMLFARFIPAVAARGGQVVLQIQPALEALFRQSQIPATIVAIDDALPLYDVQTPMMSLPGMLRIASPQQLGMQEPYLNANTNDVSAWQGQFAADRKLKVALAWAGNPQFPGDKRRSISLNALAPLAKVPNISFYGIQVGPPSEQTKNPPQGMQIVDLSPKLKDFTDTAAVLTQVDLLIAVDSAVVHLTGALGRPVWTLIPFVCDWRWFTQSETTALYPTMRLFRQTHLGDWQEPVARVADALAQLAQAKAAGASA